MNPSRFDAQEIHVRETCKWLHLGGMCAPGIRRKIVLHQNLKERSEARDPKMGLLREPSGNFDYYVLYSRKEYENASSPNLETQKQVKS